MTPTKCKRRHTKTILAIMTVLAMLMSLVTVAAAAEPSIAEQRLQAQAIAQSAQSLRLSATELDLKAGDTYELRVLPAETATAMGWQFDEEKLAAANSSFLTVENVDQAAMTVTVKAVRSGGNVPVKVELANPTLMALAKAHSSLMTYVRLAQNSLQQYMVCQVATNDTATQVVAGLEAPAPTATKTTTTAAVIVGGGSSSSGISGGSGTTLPPQQPEDPNDSNAPGSGDQPGTDPGTNPGGNQPGTDPGTNPGGNTGGNTGGSGDDDPGNDPGTVPPPVEVEITTTPTFDPDAVGGAKVTVSMDDAQAVADAIAAKMEDLGDGDESTTLSIALDATQSGQAAVTDLNLSADVVAALKDAATEHGKEIVVTVTSDTGTVQLPLGALEKAQDNDDTAAVTLAVSTVDSSTLTDVTDENGDEIDATALENAVIVDVTLKVGDQAATIEGLTENIVITVAAPSGAERVDVYFIKDDNSLEHVGTYGVVEGSEQVTFDVDHLTTFVVKEAESAPDDPGTDVPPVVDNDPCKDGHTGTADENGNCSVCGKPMGGSSGGDEEDPPAGQCPHGKDPAECEECKAAGGDNPGDDGKCEHGSDPATCPDCNKESGGDGDGDGDGTEEPGTNPGGTTDPGINPGGSTTEPGGTGGGDDNKDPDGQEPGKNDGDENNPSGSGGEGTGTEDNKDPDKQEPTEPSNPSGNTGDKDSGEQGTEGDGDKESGEAGEGKDDAGTNPPAGGDSGTGDTENLGGEAGGVDAGQQAGNGQSGGSTDGNDGANLDGNDQELAA